MKIIYPFNFLLLHSQHLAADCGPPTADPKAMVCLLFFHCFAVLMAGGSSETAYAFSDNDRDFLLAF
jgi:hypothetical protein